jgi:hypothetical protein
MFHGRVVAEFDRGWKDDDLVAAIEGVSGDMPPATASPASAVPASTGADEHGR